MSRPSDPRDSPGVRFPPPLIYIAGFLAGQGLSRLIDVPLLPAGFAEAGRLAAKVFVASGGVLILVAFVSFVRHRTAIAPSQGASRLITGSLYGLTRNPIYLGFTSMYLGAVLRVNGLWSLLCLVPVLWIMNRYVIAREEQHLQTRFGEAYSDYCRRVRRWL